MNSSGRKQNQHKKNKNKRKDRFMEAISADDAVALKRVAQEEKIDVTAKQAPTDTTYLHIAAMLNKPKAGQALIDLGADIHAKTKSHLDWLSDTTAMHSAALSGSVDFIDMLVENHAELDCIDASGFTPLQLTTQYGKVKAAQRLLFHGADPTLINKVRNQDAYALALEEDEPELAELFKAAIIQFQQKKAQARKSQNAISSEDKRESSLSTLELANHLSMQLHLSESHSPSAEDFQKASHLVTETEPFDTSQENEIDHVESHAFHL